MKKLLFLLMLLATPLYSMDAPNIVVTPEQEIYINKIQQRLEKTHYIKLNDVVDGQTTIGLWEEHLVLFSILSPIAAYDTKQDKNGNDIQVIRHTYSNPYDGTNLGVTSQELLVIQELLLTMDKVKAYEDKTDIVAVVELIIANLIKQNFENRKAIKNYTKYKEEILKATDGKTRIDNTKKEIADLRDDIKAVYNTVRQNEIPALREKIIENEKLIKVLDKKIKKRKSSDYAPDLITLYETLQKINPGYLTRNCNFLFELLIHFCVTYAHAYTSNSLEEFQDLLICNRNKIAPHYKDKSIPITKLEVQIVHNNKKNYSIKKKAEVVTLKSKRRFFKSDLQGLHFIPEATIITKIDLSYNNLTELPEEILTTFPNLTDLILAHNKLKNLPYVTNGASQITHLDCSNNKFKDIPLMIYNLKRLTHLNISHNSVEVLLPEIKKLLALEELNIKYNPLKLLAPSTPSEWGIATSSCFDDMPKLSTVKISNFTGDLPILKKNTELKIINKINKKKRKSSSEQKHASIEKISELSGNFENMKLEE